MKSFLKDCGPLHLGHWVMNMSCSSEIQVPGLLPAKHQCNILFYRLELPVVVHEPLRYYSPQIVLELEKSPKQTM